jgi:hypothetical protein
MHHANTLLSDLYKTGRFSLTSSQIFLHAYPAQHWPFIYIYIYFNQRCIDFLKSSEESYVGL